MRRVPFHFLQRPPGSSLSSHSPAIPDGLSANSPDGTRSPHLFVRHLPLCGEFLLALFLIVVVSLQ